MSTISDRLLVLLIAATALGGALWWVVGYILATMAGTTRLVLAAVAVGLYGAILLVVWLEFTHLDRTAERDTERA